MAAARQSRSRPAMGPGECTVRKRPAQATCADSRARGCSMKERRGGDWTGEANHRNRRLLVRSREEQPMSVHDPKADLMARERDPSRWLARAAVILALLGCLAIVLEIDAMDP